MTAWTYKMSLLVLKYFTCSLRSLVKSLSGSEVNFVAPHDHVISTIYNIWTFFPGSLKKGLRSPQNGDREELRIITSRFLQKVQNTVAQNGAIVPDRFCV